MAEAQTLDLKLQSLAENWGPRQAPVTPPALTEVKLVYQGEEHSLLSFWEVVPGLRLSDERAIQANVLNPLATSAITAVQRHAGTSDPKFSI